MGQKVAWSRALLLNFGTRGHQTANTVTGSKLSLLTYWTKKAKINYKN